MLSLIVYVIRFNTNNTYLFQTYIWTSFAQLHLTNAKIFSFLVLLKSCRKNQHPQKLQFRHLRLEIFLTFSESFWVFEAHFLIKRFFFIKKNVYGVSHTCSILSLFSELLSIVSSYVSRSSSWFLRETAIE